MAQRSRRYAAARELVVSTKRYTLAEAVKLVRSFPGTKFEQTIDLAIRLGVDPKKPEENVRGSATLPAGTGKKVRVIVFAKGDKEKEAREAGADVVGAEELVDKIANEGWLDFDKAIATPDMMRVVGKVARVLGPRGLMPNPKDGTVTNDVATAVTETKGGKVTFRTDKAGIVHTVVGKSSFTEDQLTRNALAVLDAVNRLKPSTSKGVYFRGLALSATMSPAVRLDPSQVEGLLKERT